MAFKNRLFGRTAAEGTQRLAAHYCCLDRWSDIYSGGGDWRYTGKGGVHGGTRKVASLGAAKAVCAELARLCFTEGTDIVSADAETQEFVTRVLEQNRFAQRFPQFLERAFALGGGVIKVFWDDGVRLDFIDADRFVPLEWNSAAITGGAFLSHICSDGRRYELVETQRVENGSLVIENRLYTESGAREKLSKVLPRLKEKSVIRGMTKPLFVYLGTGTSAMAECPQLGASVFAGAADTLKNLDIVFDSLGREFILGKKRIIVPYYAIRGEYDDNGDIKHYFDVNDEVFQAMSVSDGDELKITDNTAELRVTEHTDALNALLDLLCMQVGLSEGALSYKNGTVRTATEVVSRNSRTYRTQAFYRSMVNNCLGEAVGMMCVLGKMAGALSDGALEKATVEFADGAAEDDSARTDRALKLYNAGVISRARALSQIYGISLDEARSIERTDNDEETEN